MKNIITLAIIILTVFAAGCAGDINGTVYLDRNGNGVQDPGEPGLGKVIYKVTMDGAPYKSGVTGPDGGYSVSKADKISRVYCVIPQTVYSQENQPSINMPTPDTSSSTASSTNKVMLAKGDTITTSPGTAGAPCDTAGNLCNTGLSCSNGKCGSATGANGGSCNANDGDCVSGLKCNINICGSGNVQSGQQCSNDGDCIAGLTCSVTDKTCTTSSQPTGTSTPVSTGPAVSYSTDTSAPKGCATVAPGYSSKASLLIGVVPDPKNAAPLIPSPPDEIDVVPNEEFEVIIYSPSLATLQTLQLPSILKSATDRNAKSGGSLDLSTITPNPDSAINAYDITKDVINKIAIRLIAGSLDNGKPQTVYLKPKAISSIDSSTISLGTYKIVVNSTKTQNIVITPNTSSPPYKLGDEVTVDTKIENKGDTKFYDDMTLTITPCDGCTIEPDVGPCHFVGVQAVCSIANGQAQPASFKIKLKLPSSTTGVTSFAVTEDLTFESSSATSISKSIQFNVTP